MIKKTFGGALTTTLTDIYEVPAGKKAEWVMLYITNTSGSTATFNVKFYDASAATALTVFDGYSLSSKEFFQIGGDYNEFIFMEEGDKIQASSSAGMAILVSLKEYNDIIKGG
jgi:hypothetical protein